MSNFGKERVGKIYVSCKSERNQLCRDLPLEGNFIFYLENLALLNKLEEKMDMRVYERNLISVNKKLVHCHIVKPAKELNSMRQTDFRPTSYATSLERCENR
eukprot:UN14591